MSISGKEVAHSCSILQVRVESIILIGHLMGAAKWIQRKDFYLNTKVFTQHMNKK